MNRGYIKFWRKAQDSSSWNRGLMYQGLIINLLSRAVWKKASYKGRDLMPGQFGAVLGQLADSLSVPKTTLHRMVSHLVEDGFLAVENVGNRFTIITVINWGIYQDQSKDSWNTDGTPMEHQRNAGGTPSYKEEEVKNINTLGVCFSAHAHVASSVPEKGFPENSVHTTEQHPKKLDSPSKGHPQWTAFQSCWDVYPVQQGKEEAWCEWMRLYENGTLAAGWEIRDAVLQHIAEDSRWKKGKVPKFSNWLRGKRWDDDPYREPQEVATTAQGAHATPRPLTPYQRQRSFQEQLASSVLQAKKAVNHGNENLHSGTGWQALDSA